MLALLQRVSTAKVHVAGECIAQIGQGLVVFVGVEPSDTNKDAEKLGHKVLHYRIFNDTEHKMNLSVIDVHGEVLWVPQFTLSADTQNGLRPSFITAAPPEQGMQLFNDIVEYSKTHYPLIACGYFKAHMDVSLVNMGPVTFLLQTGGRTLNQPRQR